MASHNYVLAITGASGTAYAVRLAQVVLQSGASLHLVASEAARQVALRELGTQLPAESATPADWLNFLTTAFDQPPSSDWGFANFECPKNPA